MIASIVIVNWNTCELLRRCLIAVCTAIQMLQSNATETIVVDNASTDGSTDMLMMYFPWVKVIKNQDNVGFARANNQVLHQSSGKYILLLNSDTELMPTALCTLVAILETHPRAGASGPLVFNPDGTLQNSFGALPTVLDEIVGPYWADYFIKPWGGIGNQLWSRQLVANVPRVADRVSFACTLIRRTALDEVGLLDEDFEFYSEDYDWFKRLKAAGWSALFCPQAEIIHHWGASSRQRSEWSLRQLYRSKRRYFVKHNGVLTERVLRFGLSLRFATKLAVALILYPLHTTTMQQQVRLNSRLLKDMFNPL